MTSTGVGLGIQDLALFEIPLDKQPSGRYVLEKQNKIHTAAFLDHVIDLTRKLDFVLSLTNQ